jgi:deferrochelatase/peroxidase EfeB
MAAGGYELGQHDVAVASSAAAWPFFGTHQSGIATPQQDHLVLGAFDLVEREASELQQLLRAWSTIGADLQACRRPRTINDPGEADELAPARLTLTFGLGPELFERGGDDVLGLRRHRPAALQPIGALPGDELQPARSGGDLCVQACANDPQVAFHAVHSLTLAARGIAVPRWAQAGFLPRRAEAAHAANRSPRNLMGFKDGTNNIRADDAAQMREHVWVGAHETPAWMRGGSYLVVRRIRMLLDVWDGLTTTDQEHAIGRRKQSRERLGHAAMPPDAHVNLAAAKNNSGVRILRRGYSYNDGVDPDTGQIDAGLVFICFQRDPRRQFTAIQRRLGVHDALAKHLSHTSSAVFACPPGASPGGYVGEHLFTRI